MAVSFTPSGDTLLSGSDDRRIIAWNWAAGERTIVSCAADGQVRLSLTAE
ncbi:WD_REPEATS_REGION domain-containing protein [Haematococcus lacustris]|uniref:WD_REPEATS_REGION domain-containing protein n=1 Tax=Haematococcus lacustris TaxID=44745 RepID=A0A699YN47_HAELA|nr:WD_REPEATS_REGION domain-containing protein [Haematococcus lacustris]